RGYIRARHLAERHAQALSDEMQFAAAGSRRQDSGVARSATAAGLHRLGGDLRIDDTAAPRRSAALRIGRSVRGAGRRARAASSTELASWPRDWCADADDTCGISAS